MGMYTELNFNARLRGDTPDEVIETLKVMVGKHDADMPFKPQHPLFQTDRWEYMLRMDSYYFSADTHSTLRHDEIAGAYFLCIQCNLKNYDDEIAKFIDWIKPHVDEAPGAFLGYTRYEENREPTLIYL